MDLFLPTRFPFTRLFNRDLEASGLAQMRAIWNKERVHSAVFLGEFLQRAAQADLERIEAEYGEQFPNGVPAIPVLDLHFLLEDGIDHLIETTAGMPQPHFSYYHFYPPHQPYRTRAKFHNRFRIDGVEFPEKPASIITEGQTQKDISDARRHYDETLLYVDAEFQRLHTALKDAGRLENTWLILTSDHGELFERGNIGHETPMAYDPEVRVPLLIFPPGQIARTDVRTPTSAVDLLPTVLHIAGLPVPAWAEGRILPPFSPQRIPEDRSVFVLHPKSSRARQPISEGSAAIIKENLKLIYTFGLKELEGHDPYIELYDLAADPEELENLYTPAHPQGQALLAELLGQIERADQPYR
jgi:arylsulfatase A-like enzyme